MTITTAAPRASAYRGKLRWWTELPLIAVVYALYSGARLMVRGDVDDAVEHGADILHFEQLLHLDPERFINRLFSEHAFLGVPADFDYASLHYVVTPTVLVWLWRRRPTHYRAARAWLMISTLIGLAGFTVVPTAPPRLLPGRHFIDSMSQYGDYGWWGTDASAPRGMGHLTNQYAAMPSLHVGWSLWCGVQLFRYGRHPVLRVLGVLYPLTTAIVVMGTANHYLMDALAGAAVMTAGALLARPLLRGVDWVYAKVGLRPAGAVTVPAVPVASSAASTVPAGFAGGTAAAPAQAAVGIPAQADRRSGRDKARGKTPGKDAESGESAGDGAADGPGDVGKDPAADGGERPDRAADQAGSAAAGRAEEPAADGGEPLGADAAQDGREGERPARSGGETAGRGRMS
ncbi:phosphatase PAP2 family protein [Actinacidiphila acididurans]|uniref:Phosphatase PAP2 family protein n=1 Tax=Actinacidiphila acididurans TaxID=2784346 RepID=A0ABS2TZJ3_9ACTN|nr:phosphatase PAP2 family protein [Actinacidiphila acididurans]MBM9508757.1 phosphatase PAP2 family protein [Actinacidiphila acididurans]